VPYPFIWLPDDVLALVALRAELDPAEVAENWDDLPGADIDWQCSGYGFPDENEGVSIVDGVLHPDSLAAERVRGSVEFRVTGPDPVVDLSFMDGPAVTIAQAQPIPGDGDWMVLKITFIRQGGEAFGDGVDMFEYRTRDVEVRVFRFADMGPVGDLNMNGGVEGDDLMIVASNLGAQGHIDPEDGDANQDGAVDSRDAQVVIEGMSGP